MMKKEIVNDLNKIVGERLNKHYKKLTTDNISGVLTELYNYMVKNIEFMKLDKPTFICKYKQKIEDAKKNNQIIMLNPKGYFINTTTGEVFGDFVDNIIDRLLLKKTGINFAGMIVITREGWILNTLTGKFFDNKL